MPTNMLTRLIIAALGALGAFVSIIPPGLAADMQIAPVLAQPLGRGEIIRAEGIVDLEVKRSPAGFNYITDRDILIGMAAKHPLRAGVPLRIADITRPNIIKKGDMVTVAFESPGLSLTVSGKALEDGISGQGIRVMNTQTNRAFDGVAVASGYVLASPLTNNAPAQHSSRQDDATTASNLSD